MHSIRRSTLRNRHIVRIFVAGVTFAWFSPAVGQGPEYELQTLPLNSGFTSSRVRGISERGWGPLTIVGTMENTQCKASCWICVSQKWAVHELPGIDPNADSWANAVEHVPVAEGEWTIVGGAASDGLGGHIPMKWDNVKNVPWSSQALPTLNGGDGEVFDLFLPDGTPVRALLCGWSGELPPMEAGVEKASRTMKLRVPVIWETTQSGERLIRPEFGAGLEGHVNNIGPSGLVGFRAVGGGQVGTGAWMPLMWTSTDDGETWQRSELPLPLTATSGEAVDYDYDEQGVLVVAGWEESTGGMKSPLVWELDLNDPLGMWTTHELPVPAGSEGGANTHIHKIPGRTTYASPLSTSADVVGVLWERVAGGGWVMYGPSEYLTNPQAGTPISPAGIDAFGRIAATVVTAPPTVSTIPVVSQTDTLAGLLVPSPPTGIDHPVGPLRRFIEASASPNPFNPTVRIDYTLPRDGLVALTIHDATGRVVRRIDEGLVRAGIEQVVSWDGTADDGNRVASGVYLVRIVAPYEIATVKIILVK